MKILQINTVYRDKSTGRTCYEVSEGLKKRGHEGYTAYGFGKHTDKNTYRIGNDIEYYIHNIFSRISGKQGYFSKRGTKKLINYIEKLDPDVIHLRNLHANYLNLPILFDYLSKADTPVVQSLHDCWSFTGKCAYYSEINCQKWERKCEKCPKVKSYPTSIIRDCSEVMYQDKKKWYSKIKDLTVIGVSKWVANEARKSFLSDAKITSVYNWVNQDVFKPYKENIFEKYGIEENKFTIIGVSAFWKNGTPRLEDFKKLAQKLPEGIQLVLVGKDQGMGNIPSNIKKIPYISDVKDLAKLYSHSNVYVHFSIEDTFGKVIAEAMACGTPVIVYNSTACPEIVGKNCGYVVEPRDVEAVLKCVEKIRKRPKNFYIDECLNHVKNNFNYEKNIDELVKVYERILK